ncbi:hypothetical protein KM043_009904 [Ampulex compressa]|nr:hypothetical protein KM043_009904 [Ampulex compressa]
MQLSRRQCPVLGKGGVTIALLYRANDIGLLRRVHLRERANHGEAVPVPETGSEGISDGCVGGIGTYASVRGNRGRVREQGEDIESDSRRTGHNFRPTRSELLMTSLPPPRRSRLTAVRGAARLSLWKEGCEEFLASDDTTEEGFLGIRQLSLSRLMRIVLGKFAGGFLKYGIGEALTLLRLLLGKER